MQACAESVTHHKGETQRPCVDEPWGVVRVLMDSHVTEKRRNSGL